LLVFPESAVHGLLADVAEPYRWMSYSLGPDLAVIDTARNVLVGAYQFETKPNAFS
jgi:hypothetical protein